MKATDIKTLCENKSFTNEEIFTSISSYFIKSMKFAGADNITRFPSISAMFILGSDDDLDILRSRANLIPRVKKYYIDILKMVNKVYSYQDSDGFLISVSFPPHFKLLQWDSLDYLFYLKCEIQAELGFPGSFIVKLYVGWGNTFDVAKHQLSRFVEFTTEEGLHAVRSTVDEITRAIRLNSL